MRVIINYDWTSSIVEAEDFYPYGGLRVDTKTSGYGGVRNKYAGTIYDALSGLNYAQARYQNSNRGQFISEDPIFLGDPKQQTLTEPESLNSYGYANDNPISRGDPNGLQVAGGADDLAAFGLAEYLVPIVRAGLTTGLANMDFHIASNVVQSTYANGQLSYTATPWDLANSFGQGVAFGTAGETGAGFLSPYLKILTNSARTAKLASEGISAAAVAGGADIMSGNDDPSQVLSDTSFSLLSTMGATRAVGIPRGPDVQSFGSPVFFNGANMSNSARNAVTAQAVQTFAISAYTAIIGALRNVVSSLQAQRSAASTH